MFGTSSPFGATSSTPFAPNNVSPNPFATTSSSPFGSSQPANPFASATMSSPFGQQNPPTTAFGSSTGVFGAPQPAFGSAAPVFGTQSSAPTFGASPSPFGGTSVFGQAKPDGGGFGSFGSSQPNPFTTSAFGQASQPAFGQTSQPAFGSQFGSSTPTFGAPSTTNFAPAFGATSTSAFGASAPIFGASSTPAFGATSVPAFGASSTPAFGSTSAFGSTTPAFGAASTPAFGSSSVFGGASAPGFGTSAFGATNQKGGTRVQPFSPTPDTESGGVGPVGKFMTITAMPAYKNKSVEELRWEDYQANDKGGPAPSQAGSLFGQPQQSPFGSSTPGFGGTANTTPFGASQTPAFGSGGTAFGASTPAFGTSTTPAFGASPSPFGGTSSAFGQTSTPAFGQTTTPAFGQTTTPAFGQSPTPFGQSPTPFGQSSTPFGQSSTPAFGQSPTPAFGQTPTPAFGQSPAPTFGQSSTPSFGQTSAPVFGQSSTPAFGASTSASFGASSTPAFGASSLFGSSTPAFGASTPAFGASSTPAFGFGSTGSAFGASSSAFGGSSLFGSSQSSAPSFSFATSGPAFGGTPNTFGASSSASFGGPSLFGTGGASTGFGFGGTKPAGLAQSTGASTFGGFGASSGGGQSSYNFGFSASQPSQSSGPYGGPSLFGSTFGQQPQTQTVQVTQQFPTQSPFGNLPTIPDIQLGRSTATQMPTMQYGISSLPVMDRPPQVRVSSLLTPRHLTPRSKVRMHARRYHPKKDSPRVSFFNDVEEAPSSKGDVMFVQRENPRSLFIRQPEKILNTPVSQSAPDTQEKDTAAQNGVERPEVPKNGSDGQPPSETPAPESNRWSQQEIPIEDVIEESPVGIPSADKVVRSSPVKQNGTHTSEHGHRGNGYASMTGHRAGEAAIAYEHGAEVEALMPKLRSNDYYTEPRIKDLAAKERVEPGYCKRVRDFTVGRKNYGYVRWLGETDVRGLDLEGIIEFKTREVLCYMTDESKKPEVGQGLNKPAQVTLLQVKCTDKRTQQPVREGPVLDAFVRRLRSKLEEQRAKFISYDPLKEEWKFNVEHFSKYGLDDDESDGNEEVPADSMEGIEGGVGTLDDGLGLVPRGINQKGSEGMELLISHDEMQEEMQRGTEQTGLRINTPQDLLVYSLPSQLGLDPVGMQQMRSALFPVEENDSVFESRFSSRLGFAERRKMVGLSGKSQTESPERTSSVGRIMNRMSPGVSNFLQLTSVVNSNMQMVISPSLNRRGLSPFSRTEGISSPGLTGGSSLISPYVSKFPLSGFSDPALLLVKGKAGHGSDVGLFLGRSFRVGWGPNGVFVHPAMVVGSKNAANNGLSSRITVQKVALDQAVRDKTGKVRKELIETHLVKPLELHRRLISTEDEVVHQHLMSGLRQEKLQLRKVKCSKHKLLEVCDQYNFFGNQQAKISGISSGGALFLQHQEMVWELTKILFSDWESGRPLVGLQKVDGQDYLQSSELPLSPDTELSEDRERQDMEEINQDEGQEIVGTQEEREDHSEEMIDVEDGMENQLESGFEGVRVEEVDAFSSPLSKMVYGNVRITDETALCVHKARVSHWVQENVEHLVEKELSSLTDEWGLLTIFSHLTGHQLEEAVLKSIICGDVRLGLLLGEAGIFTVTQADVISQLKEWEEQAVEDAIENDRKNIYHLLGGQLDLALVGRSIDWKRYLGLLMWYQMSPDSDLRSIIRTFEALVNSGEAPQPIPMYVEEGLEVGAPPPLSRAVFDTCYHLMLLHANAMEGVKLGGENLSNMFRTSASTYDWLDAQLGWHLHSVLQAVGAIESGGLHALYMNFASQLLAVGQIHLALYVILHMPSTEGWEGLHEKTVREVLNLYCPVWRQSVEQCDFMRTTLRLPSKWIHGAQALYCRYHGDKEEELDHLLSSGQWLEAHTVYVQEIVAMLFSEGREEEAKRQVELLEAHKEEINGWETGGSLVYDYFRLTEAFSDADFAVEELNSREKRTKFCEGIFSRARLVLESDTNPIPLKLRVCLSTLLDEISTLLIEDKDTDKIEESLVCHFLTDRAPLPEDLLLCRLQDSATTFTEWLVKAMVV